MRLKILLMCIFLILSANCSTKRFLYFTEQTKVQDEILMEEMNHEGEKKKGLITTIDGNEIIAKSISISRDTTRFIINESVQDALTFTENQEVLLLNNEIDMIRFEHTDEGLLYGFAWGVFSGAFVGNISARIGRATMDCNEDCGDEDLVIALFSSAGAALGGVVGMITGASIKAKHYYYFNRNFKE